MKSKSFHHWVLDSGEVVWQRTSNTFGWLGTFDCIVNTSALVPESLENQLRELESLDYGWSVMKEGVPVDPSAISRARKVAGILSSLQFSHIEVQPGMNGEALVLSMHSNMFTEITINTDNTFDIYVEQAGEELLCVEKILGTDRLEAEIKKLTWNSLGYLNLAIGTNQPNDIVQQHSSPVQPTGESPFSEKNVRESFPAVIANT